MVYPHHGAGKVLKKEMKEVLGEKREYLTIKILHNDMTVMVPCCNADKAGLRRVIGEDDVKKVLTVLRDDVSQMPKNWNRRFKHNREKIKTGDVFELAEVVRNLAIRESEKGLSTGEKQMYTRAKKILASELMYALDMEEDEAESHLEDLIAEAHAGRNGAARLRRSGGGASPTAMTVVGVLAAGGSGERLGSDRPKAFVVCAGRPLYEWSVDVLARGVRAGGGGRAGRLRGLAGSRGGWQLALGIGAQRPGGRARGHDRRGARRRAPARDRGARASLRGGGRRTGPTARSRPRA